MYPTKDEAIKLLNVKERYGNYPQNKWDKHIELKLYFENKMGKKLEQVIN